MSSDSESQSPGAMCDPGWDTRLITVSSFAHPLRAKYAETLISKPLWQCNCPGNALVERDVAHMINDHRKSIRRCPTFSKKYKFIKKLGEGGFGVTWIARVLDKSLVSPGTEYVAIKLQKLFPDTGLNQYCDVHHIPGHGLVASEALALSLVTPHPHLASVIEAYVHRSCFVIVMDLVAINTGNLPVEFKSCSAQDLVEYDRIEEAIASKLLFQLFDIFKYLQDQHFCHRDGHLANVLIDKYYKLFLIDFGLAAPTRGDGARKADICRAIDNLAYWLRAGFRLDVNQDNDELTDVEYIYDSPALREEWLSQDAVDLFTIARDTLQADEFVWDWNEIASLPWLSGWFHDSKEDFVNTLML